MPERKRRYPSQNADKFVIRMPEGLRASLRSEAESRRMSANNYMVAILSGEIPAPGLFDQSGMLSVEPVEAVSFTQSWNPVLGSFVVTADDVWATVEGLTTEQDEEGNPLVEIRYPDGVYGKVPASSLSPVLVKSKE